MVAWWAARERKLSRSGTPVRPAILVMITDWDTPGSVSSPWRLDAAPQKELTRSSFDRPVILVDDLVHKADDDSQFFHWSVPFLNSVEKSGA